MSSIPAPKHPLAAEAWAYILKLYGQPGVSDTCVDWQDRLGGDAIIILWLLWLGGDKSRALSDASLRTIDRHASDWREATILPIRLARRASGRLAKAGDQDAAKLYARLKRLELTAERLSLSRIIRQEELGAHHPNPELAATTNLERYLACLSTADSESERQAIRVLVAAACSVSDRSKPG